MLPTRSNGAKALAYLDNGTNVRFINSAYVYKHQIPTFPLAKTRLMGLADRSYARRVTHYALVNIEIGGVYE
jgi:hypothetical protein